MGFPHVSVQSFACKDLDNFTLVFALAGEIGSKDVSLNLKIRIGTTGAREKHGAMAPAPRGSAKIFYRGRSGSGIGSIAVEPVPVDQKPTKFDQPDADEQYKTALAERNDQAEQRDREFGIKYKIGTQGHQAKRYD